MFTGIVQDVGRLARSAVRGAGKRLAFTTALDAAGFELGESVAVNGVCLTVAARAAGTFEADASPETLAHTSLGALRLGDPVNLERALRPVDRLGGHFVLGHVDGVGRFAGRRPEGAFEVLRFEAPREVTRYLVAKGSIAVDGISLTVTRPDEGGFEVAVIPHTLERTNLPARRAGDAVNLEADILGKYVEKLLAGSRAPGGGVTLEALARAGFVR